MLLHLLAVLGLFGFLVRATGETWPSAFVAMVFAVHPLHAEAVAWVSERKLVLAGSFWMWALFFYVGWARSGRRRDYAATGLAFALALLSKPTAVTLPCVMLLLDGWPLARRFERALFIEKLPFFALSALASFMTLAAQSGSGAVESITRLTLADRVSNALVAYASYLLHAFWPAGLAVYYPHPMSAGQSGVDPAGLAVSVLLFSGLTILAVIASRRGQRAPLVGWLWFVGVLFPMIGIVQVGSAAYADRYAYLPLVGISWGVAFWAWSFAKRDARCARWLAAFGAGVLVLLAVRGVQQVSLWRDSETLFLHTLEHTHANMRIHTNLAGWYQRVSRYDEARSHFERALEIAPGHPVVTSGLAGLERALGDSDAALRLLESGVDANPQSASLLAELGRARLNAGAAPAAYALFERAAAAGSPLYGVRFDVHMGLGDAAHSLGLADALVHYRAAAAVDARAARPHSRIAWILATDPRQRDVAAARVSFARYCELAACDTPGALRVRAAMLAASGRFDEAAATAQAAIDTIRNPRSWLAVELRSALDGYRNGQAWTTTASP